MTTTTTSSLQSLCVLTRIIDDSDVDWATALTLVDTMASLKARVDLSNGVPYGWLLLEGEAAKRFLEALKREELWYQREQEAKHRSAGNN
jgi:hypothetical protein